jgi:predicted RNA-binding protein with PUA-like domain
MAAVAVAVLRSLLEACGAFASGSSHEQQAFRSFVAPSWSPAMQPTSRCTSQTRLSLQASVTYTGAAPRGRRHRSRRPEAARARVTNVVASSAAQRRNGTGVMAHWLMKTEPDDYSWEQLVKDRGATWDGVHNHQAARNMRSMKVGERAFFYRSMVDPGVVGIMEIVRAAYEDPSDPKASFVLVDVAPVIAARHEVSLKQIKAEPRLGHLALVRQSRLSVSPVDDAAWRLICDMAGVDA